MAFILFVPIFLASFVINCPQGTKSVIVKNGDTCYGLGLDYGISESEVIAFNPGGQNLIGS